MRKSRSSRLTKTTIRQIHVFVYVDHSAAPSRVRCWPPTIGSKFRKKKHTWLANIPTISETNPCVAYCHATVTNTRDFDNKKRVGPREDDTRIDESESGTMTITGQNEEDRLKQLSLISSDIGLQHIWYILNEHLCHWYHLTYSTSETFSTNTRKRLKTRTVLTSSIFLQ